MSSNNTSLPPLPANHLSHPENWATGSEPVTSNQAGFIKVLEGQHSDLVPEGGVDTSKLSKSDASDVIDKLKKGEKLDDSVNDSENHVESGGKPAAASSEKEESSAPSKRKEPPTTAEADKPASLEAAQAQSEEKEITGQSSSNGATTESGEVKDSVSAEKEAARPAKKARTEKKDGEAEKVSGESAEDPIEVDTPPVEDATPAETATASAPIAKTNGSNGTNGNGAAKKVDNGDETTPGDEAHLDHPENWATGDQPATDKQKGFIKVLEKQKGAEGVAGNVESLGKSEASEKIDELKKM